MLDLIVIGGGVAGYAAALRTSQLGGKVLLVEKDKLGGTCLHRGCIPSKVLFQQSAVVEDYRSALKSGLFEDEATIKLEAVANRQNEVVHRLYLGLEYLFRKRDIPVIHGCALIEGAGRVLVEKDNVEYYKTRNILIATGSEEKKLAVPGSSFALSAEDALAPPAAPCSVVIIGGGNTGLELASAYSSLGFKVAVVEKEKFILPSLGDRDTSNWLSFLFKRRGIEIIPSTEIEAIQGAKEGPKKVVLKTRSGFKELEAELVIASLGRTPRTEAVDDSLGIVKTPQGVAVNEKQETGVAGIYAAGDVTGPPMLAHLAYFEGITAAENALGGDVFLGKNSIPACLAANPSLAWVGLTEEMAKEKGINYRVGRFDFGANSRAVLEGRGEGFVKVIVGEEKGYVLGMQVLGHTAEELIMQGALAIRNCLTFEQLTKTIHPHPTFSEALWEAYLSVQGDSLHV